MLLTTVQLSTARVQYTIGVDVHHTASHVASHVDIHATLCKTLAVILSVVYSSTYDIIFGGHMTVKSYHAKKLDKQSS